MMSTTVIYNVPGGDLKDRVMREMGISTDTYYLMRYELAYTYFKKKRYQEDNVRLMVLSQTFWRWWNIQLDNYEMNFLEACKGLSDASQATYEAVFMRYDVYSSWSIMRQIRREGLAAMKRNKAFSNLKL